MAALKRFASRATANSFQHVNPMLTASNGGQIPQGLGAGSKKLQVGALSGALRGLTSFCAQWKELAGVHSYDINDNRFYRSLFGLDANTSGSEKAKKRRLTATADHTRGAAADAKASS